MGKRNDESWMNFYNELLKYYNSNGNINIPAKYVTSDGIKLGNWLKKQKEIYSRARLSEDRIILLEKLGISWNYLEDLWNSNYKYLKSYYKEKGNIDVPQFFKTDDGFKLGSWLEQQRTAYKAGFLSLRRKKLLNELGIKWNHHRETWDENYYLLEEYYNTYNNIDVSVNYSVGNIHLGRWLYSQKQAYNGTIKLKITQDHIMLLNDLKIDWSPKATSFLNTQIDDSNKEKYYEVMLERMNHILEDLNYEGYNDINSKDMQDKIEKEIVKRMWR